MVKCTTNEEKQAKNPGSDESHADECTHEQFMRNHLKRLIAMTDFFRSEGPGVGFLLGLVIKGKLAEAEAAGEETQSLILRLARIGFDAATLPLMDAEKITAAAEAVAVEFGTIGDIQFHGAKPDKGEGAGDEK